MEKTTPKPQTHLKHNSTAPSKYLKGTSCTTTKKPPPCHDLLKTQWHLHCVCCGSEVGWCFIFRKKWMYGKSIAKTSNVSQTHLKHTSNAASKYLKRTSNALQQNNAVTLPRPFILLGAVFSSGPQKVYAWKNPCRNLKRNPKHVLQTHLKHTAKTTYLKLRPCQDLLIYGSAMLQIKRWTHGKNSAQTWTNASQTHPRRQANTSKAP